MRTALCLVLIAACGSSNNVAPDGASTDGMSTPGDGSGSGGGVLALELTQKPATLGNQPVSFAWSVNAGATVECRLDSDAYAECTSPHAVATVADGAHSFDARATLGQQHAEVPTYTFTLDTVAPALVLSGQPPSVSPLPTAQFHFTTDEATTVTCQLDSAAAAPCMGSVSYASLADGQHTFTLTGADGAGNISTRTYTWTVDTSVPMLTITMAPPNPTNMTSARFEFTTGSSVTVLCQIDGGAASACSSPQVYSVVGEGSHTFTLRGTNVSGQTTTVTYPWVVDTTPPYLMITSGPSGQVSSTTANFGFSSGSESVKVTCQLDAAAPENCIAGKEYLGVAEGPHTFILRATDAAGNTATRQATWTVDTIAPSVTITAKPSNPSRSATATFQFSVTGAISTTCKLDTAAATACANTISYGSLADGPHTFELDARDAAGNSESQYYDWVVNTVPRTR